MQKPTFIFAKLFDLIFLTIKMSAFLLSHSTLKTIQYLKYISLSLISPVLAITKDNDFSYKQLS